IGFAIVAGDDGEAEAAPIAILVGDAADPGGTVVGVEGIPAGDQTATPDQIGAGRLSDQKAGMGEGLAILHDIGMAIEKVANGGDDFVAHNAEEVAPFDSPIVVIGFDIELRHGEAVKGAGIGVPARDVAIGRAIEAGGGGKEEITAEEVVDVAPEKPT